MHRRAMLAATRAPPRMCQAAVIRGRRVFESLVRVVSCNSSRSPFSFPLPPMTLPLTSLPPLSCLCRIPSFSLSLSLVWRQLVTLLWSRAQDFNLVGSRLDLRTSFPVFSFLCPERIPCSSAILCSIRRSDVSVACRCCSFSCLIVV